MDRDAIRRLGTNCGRPKRRRALRLIRSARLWKNSRFYTGMGSPIKITRTTEAALYFQSVRGTTEARLTRERLLMAVSYLLRVRHIERRELEAFNRYNSALFGLLLRIFGGRVRLVNRLRTLRMILKGTRFFFSGAEKCKRDLYAAGDVGAKYVLFSYYWIRDQNA